MTIKKGTKRRRDLNDDAMLIVITSMPVEKFVKRIAHGNEFKFSFLHSQREMEEK